MIVSFPFFRFMLEGVSEHPRHQSILFEADERHETVDAVFGGRDQAQTSQWLATILECGRRRVG